METLPAACAAAPAPAAAPPPVAAPAAAPAEAAGATEAAPEAQTPAEQAPAEPAAPASSPSAPAAAAAPEGGLLSFRQHMWDQFGILWRRRADPSRTRLEALVASLHERAQIERQYGRGLASSAVRLQAAAAGGSAASGATGGATPALELVLGTLRSRAEQAARVAEELEQDVAATIEAMLRQHAEVSKRLLADGQRLSRHWHEAARGHEVAEARHAQAREAAEAEARECLNGAPMQPTAWRSLAERAVQASRRAEAAGAERWKAAENLQAAAELHERRMSLVLSALQDMEEKRAQCCRDAAMKLAVYDTSWLRNVQYDLDASVEAVEAFDASAELQDFIRQHRSQAPPPTAAMWSGAQDGAVASTAGSGAAPRGIVLGPSASPPTAGAFSPAAAGADTALGTAVGAGVGAGGAALIADEAAEALRPLVRICLGLSSHPGADGLPDEAKLAELRRGLAGASAGSSAGAGAARGGAPGGAPSRAPGGAPGGSAASGGPEAADGGGVAPPAAALAAAAAAAPATAAAAALEGGLGGANAAAAPAVAPAAAAPTARAAGAALRAAFCRCAAAELRREAAAEDEAEDEAEDARGPEEDEEPLPPLRMPPETLAACASLVAAALDGCDREGDVWNGRDLLVLSQALRSEAEDGHPVNLLLKVYNHPLWSRVTFWEDALLVGIAEAHARLSLSPGRRRRPSRGGGGAGGGAGGAGVFHAPSPSEAVASPFLGRYVGYMVALGISQEQAEGCVERTLRKLAAPVVGPAAAEAYIRLLTHRGDGAGANGAGPASARARAVLGLPGASPAGQPAALPEQEPVL